MKLKITLSLLGLLTLAAVVSALAIGHSHQKSKVAAPSTRTFHVRGEIRHVDVANKIVRITHEEIPDYMPAMTMPLEVKDPGLLNGLTAGDRVAFDLAVTADDSWISRIEKIPGNGEVPLAANVSLADREMERVQVGELVPDFKLLNQDGQPVSLSDFRGKAVVLTFIYTRCPLPNFCPLMSRNFSQLEQRLNAEFTNQFQLVSVTMDPEFDKPAVLKGYAKIYGANTRDWIFATGSSDQIKTVAELLGLYYVRENGIISHDLRTALIGPDGRLVHLWKSNVWIPYEVQRMVRESLTGKTDMAAK